MAAALKAMSRFAQRCPESLLGVIRRAPTDAFLQSKLDFTQLSRLKAKLAGQVKGGGDRKTASLIREAITVNRRKIA